MWESTLDTKLCLFKRRYISLITASSTGQCRTSHDPRARIFAASSIVVGPDLGSLDLRAVHHAGAELDGDRATVAKRHLLQNRACHRSAPPRNDNRSLRFSRRRMLKPLTRPYAGRTHLHPAEDLHLRSVQLFVNRRRSIDFKFRAMVKRCPRRFDYLVSIAAGGKLVSRGQCRGRHVAAPPSSSMMLRIAPWVLRQVVIM